MVSLTICKEYNFNLLKIFQQMWSWLDLISYILIKLPSSQTKVKTVQIAHVNHRFFQCPYNGVSILSLLRNIFIVPQDNNILFFQTLLTISLNLVFAFVPERDVEKDSEAPHVCVRAHGPVRDDLGSKKFGACIGLGIGQIFKKFWSNFLRGTKID